MEQKSDEGAVEDEVDERAELGMTPLFNKPVPTGRQVFRIRSADGETRSLTVDIKPGPNSARQDFESLLK